MELKITVRVCEVCKSTERPATRYTLTPEGGEPVTRDLCADDAAPLEAAFGPLVPSEKPSPLAAFQAELLKLMEDHERETRARRARREAEWREQNPEPAKKAPAKKAPAKRAAPAKKAAAKKAPAKKVGTKSMTVAEIEALKAEGKQ
ncbi:hypothetical protein [Streptomyces sp. NPDC094031]|uniref:hypothetical protein n=1 Tax=Streptomyces sp. NPDC094031 TaxID=3155307 RepID=UPI003326E8B3